MALMGATLLRHGDTPPTRNVEVVADVTAGSPSRSSSRADAVAIVTAVLIVIGVATLRADDSPLAGIQNASFAATVTVVGRAILQRLPTNSVGWLLLTAGGFQAASFAAGGLADALDGEPAWAVSALDWAANWTWVPGVAALPLLAMLFPTAPFPITRWWFRVVVAAIVAIMAVLAFDPGPLENPAGGANPVGIAFVEPLVGPVLAAGAVILVAFGLVGVVRQLVRLRSSDRVRRAQSRWFTATCAVLIAWELFSGLVPEAPRQVGWVVLPLLLPLAIGHAVLRHGLYDMGAVIDRTLVYGALVLVGLACQVVIAAAFDVSLLGDVTAERVGSVVLTVIAVRITTRPIEAGVRRLVHTGQPPVVAARAAATRLALADEEHLLESVSDAICTSGGFRAVRLRTTSDGLCVQGVSGVEPDWPARLVTPLTLGGSHVGKVEIWTKSSIDGATPDQRRLVDVLIPLATTAAGAVIAKEELRRSREDLIRAQEEERRRIHRDLHDGFGPTMASIMMAADTALALGPDDDRVPELLAKLLARARDASGELRTVIQNLRPTALEELGLVGSLRQQAQAISANGLVTQVNGPAGLHLPAAVEVTAYRIVSEALTNATRHARARRCSVDIRLDGDSLVVAVDDDGRGMVSVADTGEGVGLVSMQERAASLGGNCAVTSDAHGTRVYARLPLGPDLQ